MTPREYWIGLGQDDLQLLLPTGSDLSGCTVYVEYEKPSGATGQLAASIYSGDSTQVEYVFPVGSPLLDEIGTWAFWPYKIAADGRESRGRPDFIKINQIGKIK